VVVLLSFIVEEDCLKFCHKEDTGSLLLIVFFPEKFFIRRFSAADEKLVLKALAMASRLLDNLSLIFTVDILLIVLLVLVILFN